MRICFIGAGNVATNMARALRSAGHDIVQVYSRTMASATALAGIVESKAVTDINAVDDTADIYIISVKDDVIAHIAASLCPRICRSVVVHTAGSVPIDVLSRVAKRCGVIYPMQTFSKQRAVDFSEIPCFIEANDDDTLAVIERLARSISRNVCRMTGSDRRRLHLAAVYACNFANHCYEMAAEILASAGINFNVLLPLIDETARKVHSLSPLKAQTGPAVRDDKKVMEAHLRLLDDMSAIYLSDIYRLMSQSIHQKAQAADAEHTSENNIS